jgi:quinol monooxygenase YgiN
MIMLTVIAEIRTRPGQHHRQAVLDEFVKIIPAVLNEEGCHGYAPMVDTAAGVSFQTTAPDSIIMAVGNRGPSRSASANAAHESVGRSGER